MQSAEATEQIADVVHTEVRHAPSPRLETVDCLRGIASLIVCWFHFTNSNSDFLTSNGFQGVLKLSGYYGWLGVEIFFVISGFIIPWALWRANYTISQYGRFLFKRIVRVDPPYLASIVIAVALAYLSVAMPGYRGSAPSFSLAQLLAHLGYANALLGYSWIISVYWTLAIEFQYYLAIGLLFPLLISRKFVWSIVLCAAFYGSQILIPENTFLFYWLFLFSFGLVTFKFKAELLSARGYLAALALVTCLCATSITPLIASVGLATALTIAFGRLSSKLLRFFGDISYSLYLVHVLIGMRMVKFSLRFSASTEVKIIVLLMALGLSVAGAYLFYRAIELPARRWSSQLRYGI